MITFLIDRLSHFRCSYCFKKGNRKTKKAESEGEEELEN